MALNRLYLWEILEGELLTYLRKDLLKMSQEPYASWLESVEEPYRTLRMIMQIYQLKH